MYNIKPVEFKKEKEKLTDIRNHCCVLLSHSSLSSVPK